MEYNSNSMKPKAIVFIGGNKQLLPEFKRIKRFLKENDISIILTDRNPNNPLKEVVKEFYNVDGLDIVSILNIINQLKEKYDILLIYTITETYPTVLSVYEVLYGKNSLRTSYFYYNKYLFYKQLSECGKISNFIPNTFFDLEDFMCEADKGKQYVIKPSISMGAYGVTKFLYNGSNKYEIEKMYKLSKNISMDKSAVIQEFVEGIIVDVNAFVENGEVEIISITDRIMGGENTFWDYFTVMPSMNKYLSDSILLDIQKILENLTLASGLEYGPLKADLIYSKKDNKIYILEASPRFHGPRGSIYMFKASKGLSLIEWYILKAMNLDIKTNNLISVTITLPTNYKNFIRDIKENGFYIDHIHILNYDENRKYKTTKDIIGFIVLKFYNSCEFSKFIKFIKTQKSLLPDSNLISFIEEYFNF